MFEVRGIVAVSEGLKSLTALDKAAGGMQMVIICWIIASLGVQFPLVYDGLN